MPADNTVSQEVKSGDKDESNDTAEEIESSTIVQYSDAISDVVNETESAETAEESETIENPEEIATSTMEQEDLDSDTVDTAKKTLVEEAIVEDTSSTSEELDTVAETDAESTVERVSQVKQKNKDLITATGRDEYRVKAVEPHVVEKSNERHTSQSRRVREFILTLDRFSVKQVRSNFPDVPTAIVNNVIRLLKIEGLITCISRGKYVVNKT